MPLTALDSEDISQIFFTIATPKALRNILRTHRDVAVVRQHLLEVTDAGQLRQEIEEFVRERLIALKPKTYFPHEPGFCALAAALESVPSQDAEDFLSELASLCIAEMPISSRVAALCLQRHRELSTSNTQKVFKIASLPLTDAPSLSLRPPRVSTKSSYSDIFKAAA